jgi:large subunit ribosomal protein L16
MLLQPNKLKFKKVKKGKLSRFEFKSINLKFGDIGLKASASGSISARQIESARKVIKRKMKKKGKLWIRIFPDTPVTSKPNESRMGKGKGNISHWVSKVKSGTVLFEVCSKSKKISKEALKSCSRKLPIKTFIID